ncbi:MAG TPA: tetratricopeptide repeat protein [Kofleriaceae bacterium]|nr:tetratricopeptide repeat protein [Kofleriaceae bacterium]
MTAAGAELRVFASAADIDRGPLPADLLLFHFAGSADGEQPPAELAPAEMVAMAELADRLPSGAQVIAVVPRGDLATSVAAMRSHERVAGVLALEHLRVADLAAMTARLVVGDIFGLDKVLPWGTRVQSMRVADYPEKAIAVSQISAFAAAVGVRRSHRERIERCCDEMLMNALYDAPVGADGTPLPRARAFERAATHRPAHGSGPFPLGREDSALVQFGFDGQRFAVAVRDRFGRFERDTLLRYLHHCLHSDEQMERREGGGAGLGLYMMSRSASSLMFNLRPGAATECICLFDLDSSRIELDQIGVFEQRVAEPLALPPDDESATTQRAARHAGWRVPALLRGRLGLVAAAAGVAVLFGGAGGLWLMSERGAAGTDDRPCAEAGDEIAPIWPARRAAVEKAFRAIPVARSAPALASVDRALDDYALAWRGMAVQACNAARSGQQSQLLHERRAGCLAHRRRELADVVEVLAGADSAVVEHAVDAVQGLGPIARCEDPLALERGMALPDDPARRAAIEEVRGLVSRAMANAKFGRGKPARALLEQAAGRLPAAGYPPVEAEVHLARGQLEALGGAFAASKGELLRAAELAEDAGDDLVRARALVDLVHLVGYELQDFDQGELFARMARAPLQRAGDRALEATLLRNSGTVAFAARDFERARERQATALAMREKLHGPESGEVAEVLRDLAATLRELGELDVALRYAQRAFDITKKLYGVKHWNHGLSLTELGNVLTARGDYDEARKVYQETLNLGFELLPEGHPFLPIGMVNLANVELLAGRPDEAIDQYKRALDLEVKALGADHLQVSASLMNLGAAHESAGHLADAERTYSRALAIRRQHLDEHHALVGEALGSLGQVELERGRAPAAAQDLERAVAVADQAGGDRATVAGLRFALARALWKLGGEKERAHELAARAARELDEAGEASDAAEASTWAKRH